MKKYHLSLSLNPSYDTVLLSEDLDSPRDVVPIVTMAADLFEREQDAQPPSWQDNDVVAYRFPSGGKAYTYMRRKGAWPGESGRALSDLAMTNAWHEGRLTLLVRDSQIWVGRRQSAPVAP